MRLIVDGSNVALHRWIPPNPKPYKITDWRWGWEWLDIHLRFVAPAVEVTQVVYDTQYPYMSHEGGMHQIDSVKTQFVKDADKRIVDLALPQYDGEDVCVVTSDVDLQRRCKRQGANVLASGTFIRILADIKRFAPPASAEAIVQNIRSRSKKMTSNTFVTKTIVVGKYCDDKRGFGTVANTEDGVFIPPYVIREMASLTEVDPCELEGYEFMVTLKQNLSEDHKERHPYIVQSVEGVVSEPADSKARRSKRTSTGNGTKVVASDSGEPEGRTYYLMLGNLEAFAVLAPHQERNDVTVYYIKPSSDEALSPTDTGYITANVYHPSIELAPEQEELVNTRRALIMDSRRTGISAVTKKFLEVQIAQLNQELAGVHDSMESGLSPRPVAVTFVSKAGTFPYLDIHPLDIGKSEADRLQVLNVVPVGCGSRLQTTPVAGTRLIWNYFGKSKIGYGACLVAVGKKGGRFFADGVEIPESSTPCLADIRVAPDGTTKMRYFQEVVPEEDYDEEGVDDSVPFEGVEEDSSEPAEDTSPTIDTNPDGGSDAEVSSGLPEAPTPAAPSKNGNGKKKEKEVAGAK